MNERLFENTPFPSNVIDLSIREKFKGIEVKKMNKNDFEKIDGMIAHRADTEVHTKVYKVKED